MKNTVWLITAKTNLHVGNENTSNYGIIDKAVQRDALTGLPCINSSSLKGALDEFTCHKTALTPDDRIKIFGVDKTKTKTETKKGEYLFFDAHLLFLPVPNQQVPYKYTTCEEILKEFTDKIKLFGLSANPLITEKLKNEFLYNFDTVTYNQFKELCSDEDLPIIARNCLDNGESTNLWYEQILPRETVFYTFIKGDGSLLEKEIEKEEAIIQIGSGATIGYGYCQFTELKIQ